MYKNIMVLIELKENQETDKKILEKTIYLSEKLDASVHPVHISQLDDECMDLMIQIKQKASNLQRHFGKKFDEVKVINHPEFTGAVTDFIEQNNIDLVILGHNSDSFIQRYISFLSVAKNTIDTINIDTLIIPVDD